MTIQAKEVLPALRSAVRMTERICALPAVATQDWCDRVAAAVLPVDQPSIAVVLVGQVDEHGTILRTEATGVSGCYTAEVTTTIGRERSASPVLPLDANDASLMRVRTTLAQARELSWAPGPLSVGSTRVSTLDRTHPTSSAPAGLIRRWEGVRATGMLLGATGVGNDRRALVVEIALTGHTLPHGPAQLDADASALEAVLPILSRRAVMAIGMDATDSAHWLTVREQVILQHLLMGKSVREIAQELGRSPHTVHDHVKSLHRKLNASSRGELVARALGHVDTTPGSQGGPAKPTSPAPTGPGRTPSHV